MKIRSKHSYHPFVIVDFYLHILPEELLLQIPRSTRYEWQHKPVVELFGYVWYCQHQQLFHTLQEVAASKRLLQINTALFRIIAIQRFLQRHQSHIKHKILNAAANCQLKQKLRCAKSTFSLCVPKHPAHLLRREVNTIKNTVRT